MLSRVQSSHILNISSKGNCSPPLGNLFQYLSVFAENKFAYMQRECPPLLLDLLLSLWREHFHLPCDCFVGTTEEQLGSLPAPSLL